MFVYDQFPHNGIVFSFSIALTQLINYVLNGGKASRNSKHLPMVPFQDFRVTLAV